MPAHIALTRSLLASGVVAGAMLPIIVGVAGATRQGYSVWRNGVSQLGTGDGAWVFAVAFVLGGLSSDSSPSDFAVRCDLVVE